MFYAQKFKPNLVTKSTKKSLASDGSPENRPDASLHSIYHITSTVPLSKIIKIETQDCTLTAQSVESAFNTPAEKRYQLPLPASPEGTTSDRKQVYKKTSRLELGKVSHGGMSQLPATMF